MPETERALFPRQVRDHVRVVAYCPTKDGVHWARVCINALSLSSHIRWTLSFSFACICAHNIWCAHAKTCTWQEADEDTVRDHRRHIAARLNLRQTVKTQIAFPKKAKNRFQKSTFWWWSKILCSCFNTHIMSSLGYGTSPPTILRGSEPPSPPSSVPTGSTVYSHVRYRSTDDRKLFRGGRGRGRAAHPKLAKRPSSPRPAPVLSSRSSLNFQLTDDVCICMCVCMYVCICSLSLSLKRAHILTCTLHPLWHNTLSLYTIL